MSARLIDILLRLAPRERLLLALLVLGVLPAGLWLGLLAPLGERREAALSALQEARALNDWVRARASEMGALEQKEKAVGPRPLIGLSALEQSLISANLRGAVSGLSNRADGGIDLRFEAVDFAVLMGWLSDQYPRWGYDIPGFRLQAGEVPGVVAAEIRLAPQD